MGTGWREEEGRRRMLNIQGSFPASLRVVQPSEEEVRIKLQKAYMNKQGAPGSDTKRKSTEGGRKDLG